MPRVVFDAVVFVRALLNQRSVCGRVVFSHSHRYQLCLSTPLVVEILNVLAREELVGKLERRRASYLEAIAGLLESLKQAEAVEPADIPPASRDPKDDKVLATAKAAQADYIVSEDRDLLDMAAYQGIPIVTCGEFLAVLEGGRDEP